MRATTRTAGLLVLLALLAGVTTASAPGVIRIQPGDTLTDLARKHHTSVQVLRALNHLQGDGTIYAGQLLRVPPPPQVLRTYVVRPGDSLALVASKVHASPGEVQARNHLLRTALHAGQRLVYVDRTRPVSSRPAGLPLSVVRAAAHDRAVLGGRRMPSHAQVKAMIVRSARRHHVEPAFALAIAWQESGFQQRVVSPVDAVGIMQVLPSTARSLGRLHGRHFDLLTPTDNVEAGVILLRDLLDVSRTWQAATAGYYQGLGSVASIGVLAETKQYVRNVGYLRRSFA